LPKEAARAVAAVIAAPAAVAANIPRREIMVSSFSQTDRVRAAGSMLHSLGHPSLRPDQNWNSFGCRRFALRLHADLVYEQDPLAAENREFTWRDRRLVRGAPAALGSSNFEALIGLRHLICGRRAKPRQRMIIIFPFETAASALPRSVCSC
jgi:hypothetical protein